jgi:MFS family permease
LTADLDLHRTRSAAALFAGVAASSMGYTVMVAFLPLAAEDLLGSPRWAGVPSGLGTTGVAIGTVWLSAIMLRHGRRRALVVGYGLAALASIGAAMGAASGLFPLLAVSLLLLGAGYSASRLSRYAAAALYEPARRSAAIGWNVWAATIGAVVGPLLLTSTRRVSLAAGLSEAMGPFLLAALTFGVSAAVLRLLFPARIPDSPEPAGAVVSRSVGSAADLRLAVAAMVAGQLVMVLIMTMTPVHIRHGGHGLDFVGIVFAAHTFGMFAFSPVAGLLSDRLGRVPLIVAGSVMLAASGVLAAVADAGSTALGVALFLLGLGWCSSFVAGSALLTESAAADRRVRVQGIADSFVWGTAALAGMGSGLLMAGIGYQALSYLGAILALTPLAFLSRHHLPRPRVETA